MLSSDSLLLEQAVSFGEGLIKVQYQESRYDQLRLGHLLVLVGRHFRDTSFGLWRYLRRPFREGLAHSPLSAPRVGGGSSLGGGFSKPIHGPS